MTPALPHGKKLVRSLVLALVALVVCAALGAHAQSFQAQNVLVSDLVGTSGRTYPANVQYWDVAGQEAILFTVPSSSFLIFEDFTTGLRYVACDQGCRVEALSSSFPRLDANTASTSRFAFGDFERTFALPSGGLQTLSARPTLPAACAAAAKGSLTLTTDPCLPFGLPCGTSCLCLGCTDGDPCTVDDTCGLSKFGALTCTGVETCNRTSTAKTVIAINRRGGGGSGTAVALGVALGVGIGVPVGVLLLFLFLVLPLILLPLLWYCPTPANPREEAGAPSDCAAVPMAAGYAPATYMTGPAGTPVAVGNPLYAEPWRTAAMPQGVTGAAGAAGTPAGGIARDIPVYP
ncbi:uncharacterized protein ACA1_149440 [Acanthamoeba castellanii str. Neff]|uniref:Uncharacterized protein n=1 Tax=Acanthamoeba castellanii (strain ATCC 30010 / Neff) TaxID=1257118 RepID=L8HEE2_ACACF|nr:uncharacterized protein ACA1_149440 [Acanthamoeba castellanii str. Neff]ELR22776.1 hypothetical protein ACA1_149440 [Acanthamoeba castellanii str. Neff]